MFKFIFGLTLTLCLAAAAVAQPFSRNMDAVNTPAMQAAVRRDATLLGQASLDYVDHGVRPECVMSGEVPAAYGGVASSFGETYALFRDLYSHRLNPDQHYYLDNLLRDDPKVYRAFLTYAATGEFITTLVDDAVAHAKHQTAVLDALFTGDKYEVGQVWFYYSGLSSEELKLKLSSAPPGLFPTPAPIIPDNAPQDVRDLFEEIRRLIEQSKLPNKAAQLYLDGPFWWWRKGNFDCDDFADAMNGFLQKHLDPRWRDQVEFWNVWIQWY